MKKTKNRIVRYATIILLTTGFQPLLFGQIQDDFTGNGSLIGYTTNNSASLPDVTRTNDRYRANLVNNSGNITLHFNNFQGRLDAKLVAFPFEYIARNIGIGTQSDSQLSPAGAGNPYIFAGIQVHVPDLNSRNSSHIVVGHRGGTYFTVEGKNTVDGSSSVNDEGINVAPDGRADLRIIGNADSTLTIWWQLPGTTSDNWTLYQGTGNLPGAAPIYGDSVYIGLITYAQGSQGLPFVGTCDGIEFPSSTVGLEMINDLNYSSASIYPNPTEGEVTIKGSSEELSQIKIYTLLGQDVTSFTDIFTLNEQSKVINVSKLKSGIYTVRTKNTTIKLYVN